MQAGTQSRCRIGQARQRLFPTSPEGRFHNRLRPTTPLSVSFSRNQKKWTTLDSNTMLALREFFKNCAPEAKAEALAAVLGLCATLSHEKLCEWIRMGQELGREQPVAELERPRPLRLPAQPHCDALLKR